MGISLLLNACSGPGERDAARRAAAELRRTLAGRAPAFVTAHHDGARLWKTIRTFYAERRYEPAWIEGTRPRRQLDALLRALDDAGRHGLDPALYDLGSLSGARAQVRDRLLWPKGFEPDRIAPIDLRLTAAWLEFASDLANGVTDRPHADPMWRIRPRRIDLLPELKKAIDRNEVEQTLRAMAPANGEYRRLAEALAAYRDIEKAGGWKPLPSRLALKPNQRSPHLAALAARLAATGDLGRGEAQRTRATYDAALQAAVRRLQARHGLRETAVLTRETVAAMNVPIGARIRQIEVNMERWRWFPRDLGERHIRVNVPEYRLEVHDRGRRLMAMKVIVGAKDKPTPIFSDRMTIIVFAPYWNVPSSIAAEETLPAVIADPEFLARNNIEVVSMSGEVIDPASIDWSAVQEGDAEREETNDDAVDREAVDREEDGREDLSGRFPYRFRQRPGTTNSLGLVKFIFPNDFDVYLHDTPARTLFAKPHRALSHGCVRVEQPVQLAQYLLEDDRRWNGAAIQEAMSTGEERHVRLPHPIPVHLMYWTAFVDDAGAVHFLKDIYGHDARQWAAYRARIERVKRLRGRS